jgi:hypothetical protein
MTRVDRVLIGDTTTAPDTNGGEERHGLSTVDHGTSIIRNTSFRDKQDE